MIKNCVNILRIKPRNKADMKGLLKKFLDTEGSLDFNKVIEMPEDLINSAKELQDVYKNPKSTLKYIKSVEKRIKSENLEDYGYETAEDWARENWGSEQNCYNFNWDAGNNSVVFDTAEDPPLHIIAQLAKNTKETLLLSYADPSNNKYGQIKVKPDGECEFKGYNESNAPKEFHEEFPKTYPPDSQKPHKPQAPKVPKLKSCSLDFP